MDQKNDPEIVVLDHEVLAEVDMIKTDQIVDTIQHLMSDPNPFHQSKDTRQTNETKI